MMPSTAEHTLLEVRDRLFERPAVRQAIEVIILDAATRLQ